MKQSLKREITQILHSTPIVDNLARRNFISLFLLALIQLRKVQFSELATVLSEELKIRSNQNLIEDFFREVPLNFQAHARLTAALLPIKVKLRLTIDRTGWDFGSCHGVARAGQYSDGADRLWRITGAAVLGVTRQPRR